MAEVKFCGLTRAEDARAAALLGAAYLGVIFAGGPRRLDAAVAREVLDGAAPVGRARRVGVFGAQPVAEIASIAREVGLDVVQLHGRSDGSMVDELRSSFTGAIWRVMRMGSGTDAVEVRSAGDGVDGVLVEALVEGTLGGSGVPLDWERLAGLLTKGVRPPWLVLAGGLRSANVERAIGLVAPDVVDVSSGVESAVGVKDHELMRAFAEAAARGGR